MAFDGFKKVAGKLKKKAEETLDKAQKELDKTETGRKVSEYGKKFNDAAGKTLKQTGDALNNATEKLTGKTPEQHYNSAMDMLDEVGMDPRKTAAELKEAFKDMKKEDVAGILMDTYEDMSTEEALKLAAAIVVPGGLPLYAIFRLQEYHRKKSAANENDAPSAVTPELDETPVKKTGSDPKPPASGL